MAGGELSGLDRRLGVGKPITRRDFIGSTLVGAGATLLSGCAPLATTPASRADRGIPSLGRLRRRRRLRHQQRQHPGGHGRRARPARRRPGRCARLSLSLRARRSISWWSAADSPGSAPPSSSTPAAKAEPAWCSTITRCSAARRRRTSSPSAATGCSGRRAPTASCRRWVEPPSRTTCGAPSACQWSTSSPTPTRPSACASPTTATTRCSGANRIWTSVTTSATATAAAG